MTKHTEQLPIPLRWLGPVHWLNDGVEQITEVPLATYETTLWPSTQRGAKISRLCGGIRTTIVRNWMTRSVVVQAENAQQAVKVRHALLEKPALMAEVIATTSRFCRVHHCDIEVVGNLL